MKYKYNLHKFILLTLIIVSIPNFLHPWRITDLKSKKHGRRHYQKRLPVPEFLTLHTVYVGFMLRKLSDCFCEPLFDTLDLWRKQIGRDCFYD